jgi:hypothetical protein
MGKLSRGMLRYGFRASSLAGSRRAVCFALGACKRKEKADTPQVIPGLSRDLRLLAADQPHLIKEIYPGFAVVGVITMAVRLRVKHPKFPGKRLN